MHEQSHDIARIYLPLLSHQQQDVRRQAYLILLTVGGPGALGSLRRLQQDADPEVRRQAKLALGAVEDMEAGAAPERPPPLRVTCLGSLRVAAGAATLSMHDWSPPNSGRAGTQKVHALFGYLVHCGRHGSTRQALGEAVWGGHASAASLSRTLSTLRQVVARLLGDRPLGDSLQITGDYCRLDPACYRSDVDIFEQVYQLAAETEREGGLQSAAPLYAQAFELYGGPYMADVLPGSGWGRQRAELLAGYALAAAERLAEELYRRGDHRRCVLICLQALGFEPAADGIVALMLRAYAHLGYFGELEYAYRSYLHAAGLAPEDAPRAEVVYRTYQELVRSRAVSA